MLLAGDIGATKSLIAIFSDEMRPTNVKRFDSHKFPSLLDVVHAYAAKGVTAAVFGLPGPIVDGKCQTTNLPWRVDAKELEKKLSCPVFLLNDVEAMAYGALSLPDSSFEILNPREKKKGNRALIAAGTGLGEAGLFWDGALYHPFATEGGHADFAPRTQEEVELWSYVSAKEGHVSFERLVSGEGLVTLFYYLIERRREKVDQKLLDKLKQEGAKAIAEYAESSPIARHALDWFQSLYGGEAGNLALKMMATGGLYIGGGIAPKILSYLKEGLFMRNFTEKGRFKELLSSIWVGVIKDELCPLIGAAHYYERKRRTTK